MSNDVEQKVVEKPENIQSNNEVKETPLQETQEQINWKRFREQREIERKQKEAAEKDAAKKAEEIAALKAAMEALVSNPNNARVLESEISDGNDQEQILQKKIEQVIADRDRKYEEDRQKKEQQELPQRLASTFNDFNQVCTTENLDYIEYHYPEVAAAFKNLPDSFDKWSNIYKSIKRFVPNPDSQKEQKKAEKNFNKPQSMSVSGRTQTMDSPPVMMDDKRRADNWARMQRVMKGAK